MFSLYGMVSNSNALLMHVQPNLHRRVVVLSVKAAGCFFLFMNNKSKMGESMAENPQIKF